MEFMLQPGVYTTGASKSLLEMLDRMWIKQHTSGEGALYILSGFTNYNGGVRFYPLFLDHTRKGGADHSGCRRKRQPAPEQPAGGGSAFELRR